MQCIARNSTVRIRVSPRLGSDSIVNGQHLDKLLMGQRSPVDHFFQIEKIPNSETTFTSKRKYRNSRSRTFKQKVVVMKLQPHFNPYTVLVFCFLR